MRQISDIQRDLQLLGYAVPLNGVIGEETEHAVKEFQLAARGTAGPVDGDPGPLTQDAIAKALAAKGKRTIPGPPSDEALVALPLSWMPACAMTGIVVHWSAGAHKASALDRSHYHVMIEDDGRLVRGDRSIKDNAAPLGAKYAAHTLRHNTGIIGVSLCCMLDAIEQPFLPGRYPMTRRQWDALPPVLAALCRRYGIPVTPQTVLSHAEVQPTLGIAQRGKWDIARLAFDPDLKGARACGDLFRARTAALLAA